MLKKLLRSLFEILGQSGEKWEAFRTAFKVFWDCAGVPTTLWLALLLRFDGAVPDNFIAVYWHAMPILMALCLFSFLAFRLFHDVWSYFSVDDLVRMTTSVSLAIFVFAALITASREEAILIPRSVMVLEYILLNLWLGGGRLAARYLRRYRGVALSPPEGHGVGEKMLLVGTMDEADRLIRESHRAGLGRMVGVVGDESNVRNMFLHGLRLPHAQLKDVGDLVAKLKPDTILVMPPYNRPRDISEIMAKVGQTDVKCAFRTIPSLADLAAGHLTASSIRQVDIEDLMDRGTIELDRSDVRRFLKGKTVMVTGAGGSIGSEIVRQVAGYEPGRILLFEQSEFGLYTIEQELLMSFPNLEMIAVAGDVRQRDSVRSAFELAGVVDVVYHAAAYKHVPLMEKNVPACFQANVLGTKVLADESVRAGVDRFVLISSDKAVRPTSVMGVTKRLAERVINEIEANGTTFVSVRFGNVLGSSGSVVPLFKKQIAAGGPVTVTSESVRRFFMTIPEAVDLVLQAGTVGRHREIMVLEMGEDIRIIDLARRLIELSGLTPGKDIEIKVIGMRPGEKEYEEVMTDDENVLKTAYEKIWVISKNGECATLPSLDFEEIRGAIARNDHVRLRELAIKYVPENCFDLSSVK
jgi:FlaA1/EpsC-like NDP-sugar epimerase